MGLGTLRRHVRQYETTHVAAVAPPPCAECVALRAQLAFAQDTGADFHAAAAREQARADALARRVAELEALLESATAPKQEAPRGDHDPAPVLPAQAPRGARRG